MDENMMERQIIDAAIHAVLGRPMQFPGDYCATWAAGIVQQIWGADLLGNEFAGAFAPTEAAAHAAYPKGLALTLARRLRVLGWQRVAAEVAPAGAVVLLRAGSGYGHSVGVVLGGGWAVRRGPEGVVIQPLADVAAAWMPPEVCPCQP